MVEFVFFTHSSSFLEKQIIHYVKITQNLIKVELCNFKAIFEDLKKTILRKFEYISFLKIRGKKSSFSMILQETKNG